MTTLDKINKTLITLEVAGNQVLFIVLDEQGSINRKGNGSPDCRDNDLFIGVTRDNLFAQLKPFATEEMEDFFGKTYDIPDKKGRACDFKVLFGGPGIETGVQFLYGELSQGIPTPFRNFTIKAIELTENWFQEQKQITANLKRSETNPVVKPWRKFW
ncbi:hypothetical protein L0U88_15135 [Flavihumibacter sp. RY-1]|uniref:Uncharacterized protein n=1 Tax=Flavihumibacter fluminis TaxID=2909236 RepID=A0ABS9BLV4_9BACT|nr:hypothetical protein [Flavihumibacter fluminis]MCF1715973.1 hypothetical protein [Flavihumibacter fluminis]